MDHIKIRENKEAEFEHGRFYMWRCITAMAHADGIVCDKEIAYLTRIYDNMAKVGMSTEQHDTLINDLKEEQDVFSLLRNINDPKYRAQVIYFARLLAYKDGELHPNEDFLLKKMHIAVTQDLDMDAIKEEVANNVREELVLHDIKIDANRHDGWMSKLLDQFTFKFSIDLMKD